MPDEHEILYVSLHDSEGRQVLGIEPTMIPTNTLTLRELSDAIDNLLDWNIDAPVVAVRGEPGETEYIGTITAVRLNVVTKRVEVIIS